MSNAFSASIDNDNVFFLLWTIMTSMVDYTDIFFRILKGYINTYIKIYIILK